MDDKTFRLNSLEERLGDELHAIGLIAVRWSQVELATHKLIQEIAEIKNYPVSLALTTQLNGPSLTDVLMSISRSYSDDDPSYLELFSIYTKIHSACRENRNFLMHGNIIVSHPSIKPEIVVIQKLSSRGLLKISNYELTKNDVRRVAVDIQRLTRFGNQIAEAFVNSRKNPPQPTKISAFPVPRKLHETLRQVEPSEFALADGGGIWAPEH